MSNERTLMISIWGLVSLTCLGFGIWIGRQSIDPAHETPPQVAAAPVVTPPIAPPALREPVIPAPAPMTPEPAPIPAAPPMPDPPTLPEPDPKVPEPITPPLVQPEKPPFQAVASGRGFHDPEKRFVSGIEDSPGLAPQQILPDDFPRPKVFADWPLPPRAISPDGRVIAAVRENDVVLLDFDTGKTLQTLTGHTGSINHILFSPSNERVLTSSLDTTVREWSRETGKELRKLTGQTSYMNQLMYAPDGLKIGGICGGKKLWLWKEGAAEPVSRALSEKGYSWDLAFTADCKGIATSSSTEGQFHLWDAAALSPLADLATTEPELVSIPGSNQLATFGEDNSIRLRNASTGQSETRWTTPHKKVTHCVASQSGAFLITACNEETDLLVWNVATRQIELRLPHESKGPWFAFTGDNRRVVTYGDRLRIWDLTILQQAQKREGFTALFDGQKDHYRLLLAKFAIRPADSAEPWVYLEPHGGKVVARITNRYGLTFDTIDTNFNGSIAKTIALQTGRFNISVDTKKIHWIDVSPANGQTADLKVYLFDGTVLSATSKIAPLTGKFAFGNLTCGLERVARIVLDHHSAEQAAEDLPDGGDGASQADVTDVTGAYSSVSDLRSNISDKPHKLFLHVAGAELEIDFRHLRKLDVLDAPRGGILVEVTFTSGRKLIGFVDQQKHSYWQGKIGVASFSLELAKLRSIVWW